MSDVREEPGCYQCGSFAGTTFRLCANCVSHNEQRRDAIRQRRRTHSTQQHRTSIRYRVSTVVALGTLIVLVGAVAALSLYVIGLLRA